MSEPARAGRAGLLLALVVGACGEGAVPTPAPASPRFGAGALAGDPVVSGGARLASALAGPDVVLYLLGPTLFAQRLDGSPATPLVDGFRRPRPCGRARSKGGRRGRSPAR